jgi:hypothetical protein
MRKPITFSTARRVATPTMELTSVYKNGRDYLILPDGVGIPFKVIGSAARLIVVPVEGLCKSFVVTL